MDETRLFFRDTTKTTFFKKGEDCAGGKQFKERITVALCAFRASITVLPTQHNLLMSTHGPAHDPTCQAEVQKETNETRSS
ncbi:hypothetical protein DPMN_086905 [Dreissena polymorpha]|uniref:Uncharacterized protein n=1 Tax=Dreissena polymorpha TaxID=45954 RepID=A0A9D4KT64_DREPO|nr:hypothetical protein DPMN_086905 [Dreissena polymorpha]